MAKKIQPAVRELTYSVPVTGPTNAYLDTAKDLSMINRRLYEQSKQYFIQKIEFCYIAATTEYDTLYVTAQTAGDTWMVHNAHTKGKALWKEMNRLVLKDNPSIEGKWADYKVYLDDHHVSTPALTPIDGDGAPYLDGEWNYSDYVLPQHNVDPASGEPLAADQCNVHLVGPTLGVAGAFTSVSLVQAYAESRARVTGAPSTDPGMPLSFFNLLTDSGSQEPELATVIDAENDFPPYDADDFPGGDTNADCTVTQDVAVASTNFPNGTLDGFSAECGLVKLIIAPYKNGVPVTSELAVPPIIKVTMMPGNYKGVAALPMGQ